jgi:hypothetical protein
LVLAITPQPVETATPRDLAGKIAQEVLGHSLVSTTADTYGHLFPEGFDQAADAMERALAG